MTLLYRPMPEAVKRGTDCLGFRCHSPLNEADNRRVSFSLPSPGGSVGSSSWTAAPARAKRSARHTEAFARGRPPQHRVFGAAQGRGAALRAGFPPRAATFSSLSMPDAI